MLTTALLGNTFEVFKGHIHPKCHIQVESVRKKQYNRLLVQQQFDIKNWIGAADTTFFELSLEFALRLTLGLGLGIA